MTILTYLNKRQLNNVLARDAWLGFKRSCLKPQSFFIYHRYFQSFNHFPSTSRNAHDAMTDASDKEMRILDSFSLNES